MIKPAVSQRGLLAKLWAFRNLWSWLVSAWAISPQELIEAGVNLDERNG